MDADIRAAIQQEVKDAVKNSQQEMLSSMGTLLDNRFQGFNRDIQNSQKALAESQLAKIDETLSDNYRFKKRGNEEQHKHNNKVMTKLRDFDFFLLSRVR